MVVAVLILGGAVVLLLALLSLSDPKVVLGTKRFQQTLMGALTVAAVVFVLLRAGFAWLAVGLVLLWSAAKRFRSDGPHADESTAEVPPAGSSVPDATTPMSREEAFRVLGLGPDATRERVLAEYRRLMKKVHPDQGGTNYLAARLNEAKDALLHE